MVGETTATMTLLAVPLRVGKGTHTRVLGGQRSCQAWTSRPWRRAGHTPCLGAFLCPWDPVQPITASIPSAGAGSLPCSPRGARADHRPARLGLWACGQAGDQHPCCSGSRLSPEADIASTLSESRGSWVVAEFAGGSYSWWEAAAAVACWTKLVAALAPSRGQVGIVRDGPVPP